MAGVDEETGKPLEGFGHVRQSLRILFTTAIGSRLMRRVVGSAVPAILGRSLTAPLVLRLKTAIIIVVELWEPRFSIDIVADEGDNTPDELRKGHLSLAISGVYRPNGHLGDPTPEGTHVLKAASASGRQPDGNYVVMMSTAGGQISVS